MGGWCVLWEPGDAGEARARAEERGDLAPEEADERLLALRLSPLLSLHVLHPLRDAPVRRSGLRTLAVCARAPTAISARGPGEARGVRRGEYLEGDGAVPDRAHGEDEGVEGERGGEEEEGEEEREGGDREAVGEQARGGPGCGCGCGGVVVVHSRGRV